MVSVSHKRLVGASVSEQKLFDSLVAHEREEQEVIAAYQAVATDASSETVRYLVRLILDDERRHHRVFEELANTVRAQATLEELGPRLPYLDVHRGRDWTLLEQTRHFLAVERKGPRWAEAPCPHRARLGWRARCLCGRAASRRHRAPHRHPSLHRASRPTQPAALKHGLCDQ